MGNRGGWHPDELGAESGLSASEVSRGLLGLALAGRVRNASFGYEPVAPT
jgi:hypothetical protein